MIEILLDLRDLIIFKYKCTIAFWKMAYIEVPLFIKEIKDKGFVDALKNYKWRIIYYIRDYFDKVLLVIYFFVFITMGKIFLYHFIWFCLYCMTFAVFLDCIYVYRKYGWEGFMKEYGNTFRRIIIFAFTLGPIIIWLMLIYEIPFPW